MANTHEIASAFAEQMSRGPESLRDAAGRPASLEVELGEGSAVELGINPHSGFFLRLRVRLDRVADERRDALLADLVQLSAATRFGTGWIGGCEPDNVATLAVCLDAATDDRAIAGLIEKGVSILDPGNSQERQSVIAESLSIGESWLRG